MQQHFIDVINEYYDMTDRDTRNYLLALDESGQNTMLLTLTSKLYNMIIDKTTEIDFGNIPHTKGDITLLESYDKLLDCIQVLTDILREFKQPTDSIDAIRAALDNLEAQKDIYKKGFLLKIDIIMTTYNAIALAIVNSISYMIACTVEFIKNSGNADYKITLDKAGVARTKDSLVYSCLVQYNTASREGQIDAAFKPLIKSRAKNFATSLVVISTGMAVAAVLLNILPILRELVYFFFSINTRISQYFDLQADLLEMNVQLLKSGEVNSNTDRKVVVERQEAIARRFRKLAEFFAVHTKQADKKATNLIKQDNNDNSVNDTVDTGNQTYGNTLF